MDDALRGTVDESGNLRYRPEGSEYPGAERSFILSLGRALLSANEESGDGVCTLILEEDDLWLLRELAVSSKMIGKEPVGLNLKIKIYNALRELDSEDVMGDFSLSTEEGLQMEAVKEPLSEFIEQHTQGEKDAD